MFESSVHQQMQPVYPQTTVCGNCSSDQVSTVPWRCLLDSECLLIKWTYLAQLEVQSTACTFIPVGSSFYFLLLIICSLAIILIKLELQSSICLNTVSILTCSRLCKATLPRLTGERRCTGAGLAWRRRGQAGRSHTIDPR